MAATVNNSYIPEQGDIIMINFNPSRGHEEQGWHPALVISQKRLSTSSPFVWCVPISHGQYYHPLHVSLDSRTQIEGTIFVEQLKSFDYHARLFEYKEKIPSDLLSEVLDNIHQTL
ncbi:type II toxin-antitoxin system PemK/MazF family toxin [Lentilactobacillus parafarraginis]|nr:type II toxin-antitoxin system PemK/MazF family toxin [Lentilactobacillus parafarraginis]